MRVNEWIRLVLLNGPIGYIKIYKIWIKYKKAMQAREKIYHETASIHRSSHDPSSQYDTKFFFIFHVILLMPIIFFLFNFNFNRLSTNYVPHTLHATIRLTSIHKFKIKCAKKIAKWNQQKKIVEIIKPFEIRCDTRHWRRDQSRTPFPLIILKIIGKIRILI